MARNVTIKFLRTTRANLDAQGALTNLKPGEPYLITDENRIAVATSTSAYEAMAKLSEVAGGAHNSLTSLQGGTSTERYHLTAAQAATVASLEAINPYANQVFRYDGTKWVNSPDLQDLKTISGGTNTGIIVPLYQYPANVYTNSAINGLLALIRKYQMVPVIVIVNPASGPGTAVDANYAALVKRLIGAGATVVGYVATGYTAVSAAVAKSNIDAWRTFYPSVQGIFLDEMQNVAGSEPYYTDLTNYCHARDYYPVVGNPGTGLPSSYFEQKTADIYLIAEAPSYPTEAELAGDFAGGYADYGYHERGAIVYGVAYDNAQLTTIRKYCGWVYLTDDGGADPYNVLSTYMESVFTNLANISSGGTPAGAANQVQYNNAGAFGASANFTYNPSTNTLALLGANPLMNLGGITTEPGIPAPNTLTLYAKSIAGRMFPKWKGPSGLDMPIQQALMFNRLAFIRPASGTGQSIFGAAVTNVGTLSTPTLTATNLLTSTPRTVFTGATTAGTLVSQRTGTTMMWRGTSILLGGFVFCERFAFGTLVAGQRAFVGISDSLTQPTNVDPLTVTTPGKIGLAVNTNTGNWNLVHNSSGTAPTVIALGTSFPVNTTDLLELVLFSAPGGSSIGYRVKNLSTGVESSGTLSTNIPAQTVFLLPWKFMTNNTTAAAFALVSLGWTIESDQ